MAVASRDTAGSMEALGLIEAAGSTGAVFTVDLSDPDGARVDLIAKVEAALGPIDVLVNNSAMGGYKPVEDWGLNALRLMQEVNVWGPWVLVQQALPGMRERGRGAILNISSASAELPPGPPFLKTAPSRAGSAYGSTMAALNRLTVSMASETHGQGISANALSPQAAAATRSLLAQNWLPEEYFEPLDTMAEAALALVTGDPLVVTGRVAYSLDLLVELDRAVFDVNGDRLLAGWQPVDLPPKIAVQRARMNNTR